MIIDHGAVNLADKCFSQCLGFLSTLSLWASHTPTGRQRKTHPGWPRTSTRWALCVGRCWWRCPPWTGPGCSGCLCRTGCRMWTGMRRSLESQRRTHSPHMQLAAASGTSGYQVPSGCWIAACLECFCSDRLPAYVHLLKKSREFG